MNLHIFFLFNFINVCNTCIISVFNCYRNETEVFVLFVKFMESFFPAKVSRDEIKKEKCMVVYEHWLADEGR